MARTSFNAVIKPASMGATTYTVPAGKFAVCNCFLLIESAAGDTNQSVVAQSNAIMLLNGVNACELYVGIFSNGRHGPFVFNAGDVIGNGGLSLLSPANYQTMAFSMVGFLYDTSARKVPLNQKLTTGTTSYTVPAGKHIITTMHGIIRGIKVFVDSNLIFNLGSTTPSFHTTDYFWGPITASSGSVVSTQVSNPGFPATSGLMSGFLYNN